MKWALHIDRAAMISLYSIPRELVPGITAAFDSLAIDPWQVQTQSTEDDPSRYWIPVEGDFMVYYEIIDERHIVKILAIE